MPLKRFILSILFLNIVCGSPAFALSVNVPGDYDTIQAAIDALKNDSNLGDTVLLDRGVYEESIELATGITIQGLETKETYLRAAVTSSPAVSVTNVSNVVIRNLTFDSGSQAIAVVNSSGIKISNNIFYLGSDAKAIVSDDLSSVDIFHNTFYSNNTAVERGSEQTVINYNIFSNNSVAITPDTLTLSIDANCVVNNTVNGPNGTNVVTSDDAKFANVTLRDFHLQQASPCIDVATGGELDVVDETVADMGAYGGALADVYPTKVSSLIVTDDSLAQGKSAVKLTWAANAGHRVTHDTSPGGYKIYYDSDASGIPYEGVDGAGGAEISPIDVGNVTTYTLSDLSPASVQLGVPTITGTAPSSGRVGLHWSSVTSATTYRIYYGLNDVSENQMNVGNVTNFVIDGLVNGATYQFAVSAFYQAQYYFSVTAYDSSADKHESQLSTEANIALGDASESTLSAVVSAIPEPISPYPVLPDEGCFIATAAYGYYDAPQVQILRDFRDQIMLKGDVGIALVDWYYANSPNAAEYLNENEQWKPLVQVALFPLIVVAWITTQLAWSVQLVLLVLIGYGLAKWRRRRAQDYAFKPMRRAL